MDENEIRMSILRYVDANPKAQDTLNNIAIWWVMLERYTYRQSQVSEEAHKLALEGLLVEKKTDEPWPLYSANPKRLSDIRALVKQGLEGKSKKKKKKQIKKKRGDHG